MFKSSPHLGKLGDDRPGLLVRVVVDPRHIVRPALRGAAQAAL